MIRSQIQYRKTPNTTINVSSSELIRGRAIKTRLGMIKRELSAEID